MTRAGRWLGRALLVVFAQAAAFVAMSTVSGNLYLCGVAALAAGAVLTLALVRRQTRNAGVLLVAATVGSLATWAMPVGHFTVPHAPAGASWLMLPDGSHLWYRHLEATGPASGQVPVVAVHGGAGVPFTDGEGAVLAGLEHRGDLWIYDEVGTGYSSRLKDPHRYGLRRSIADLASMVDLAAPTGRVVLVGYSYGAAVTTTYAAFHPDRVAGLVLISPGPLPMRGADRLPGATPARRLDGIQKVRLYAVAARPRNTFIYALSLINPRLAATIVSDAEADSRYLRLYEAAAPGLVCPGERPPAPPERPLGHFAHGMAESHPDTLRLRREQFQQLADVPVLLLRGRCDYVRHAVVDQYHGLLDSSRIVEVFTAGHSMLAGDSEGAQVAATIDQFLNGL